MNGIISSMKQMEDRFNKRFQYPYVFLNEQPFSDDFKTYYFILSFEMAYILTTMTGAYPSLLMPKSSLGSSHRITGISLSRLTK